MSGLKSLLVVGDHEYRAIYYLHKKVIIGLKTLYNSFQSLADLDKHRMSLVLLFYNKQARESTSYPQPSSYHLQQLSNDINKLFHKS